MQLMLSPVFLNEVLGSTRFIFVNHNCKFRKQKMPVS